jgi:hypothetical protein
MLHATLRLGFSRQELPLPVSARILVPPLPLIAAVAREADEPTVFLRSMRVVLGVLFSSCRRSGRLAGRRRLSRPPWLPEWDFSKIGSVGTAEYRSAQSTDMAAW